MAHLERTQGGFRVVWREGGRGAKRQKSKVYDTKREAEEVRRSIAYHRAASAPLIVGTPIPWQEVLDRFLASRASRTASHRTQAERTLTTLAQSHGWHLAGDVQPAQAAALLPFHARLVRALLRFAADHLGQRVIPQAIAACRSPSPRRSPVELLTPEAIAGIQALADATSPGNGALVHLIATYGHRAESLISMSRSALEGHSLTIRVKSGDTHRHPLLPATVSRLTALAKGLAKDDPLLVSHLGRPWADSREVAAWLNHQIGVGVLQLRRYAITRMLAATHDARTVASITGHRTVSLLLNTYAQTNEKRQAQALEALQSISGDTMVTPRTKRKATKER